MKASGSAAGCLRGRSLAACAAAATRSRPPAPRCRRTCRAAPLANKHPLRETDDDKQHDGQEQQNLEGMAAGEVDFLARPEPPGADHQEAADAHEHQPDDGDPPGLDSDSRCRSAPMAASRPAAAGIGMPTKYLRPGRPGLRGCASWLMLKRASRETPPMRNRKQMKAPACSRFWRSCGIDRFGQKVESPDVAPAGWAPRRR